MKIKHKSSLVVTLILMSIPLLLVAINVVHIQARLYSLRHKNHESILAACREAIANRGSYRNDRVQWSSLNKDQIVLLPPLPSNLPLPIRDLNPKNVLIDKEWVQINLSLPFYRISIIGYNSGARQAGTTKYIDGLWLLTGAGSTNM